MAILGRHRFKMLHSHIYNVHPNDFDFDSICFGCRFGCHTELHRTRWLQDEDGVCVCVRARRNNCCIAQNRRERSKIDVNESRLWHKPFSTHSHTQLPSATRGFNAKVQRPLSSFIVLGFIGSVACSSIGWPVGISIVLVFYWCLIALNPRRKILFKTLIVLGRAWIAAPPRWWRRTRENSTNERIRLVICLWSFLLPYGRMARSINQFYCLSKQQHR